jgi:membrane protease YdiL (CAAX protease family)
MSTFVTSAPDRRVRGTRELRQLVTFAAVALPVGWLMLSVPLVADVPLEPFVLATLYLGLVLPTVVLTRRDPDASMRQLLRDTVRLPHPWWLVVPAALVVPVGTAAVGALLGAGREPSPSFLLSLALANVASSLLIVNLWEEMSWAGFAQRRAMARWGYPGGSVVVALLFTGVHLPLSLYGADGVGDVARNLAAMVVSGIGMRLVIGALDGWGGGSILPLALVHATFNASAKLVDPDADWIRYTVTFALGLGALALWSRGVGRGTRPAGDTPERVPVLPGADVR